VVKTLSEIAGEGSVL